MSASQQNKIALFQLVKTKNDFTGKMIMPRITVGLRYYLKK